MSLLALLSFNLTQQNLRAAEESACDPQYLYHAKFGSGEYSAVAAHSSGLALHFYNAGYGAVYYQVGALAGERTYWAAPQLSHGPAWRPAVTISKEGFVVAVFRENFDAVNPALAADGVFAIVVYRDNEDSGNSLYLSTTRTCYYP